MQKKQKNNNNKIKINKKKKKNKTNTHKSFCEPIHTDRRWPWLMYRPTEWAVFYNTDFLTLCGKVFSVIAFALENNLHSYSQLKP